MTSPLLTCGQSTRARVAASLYVATTLLAIDMSWLAVVRAKFNNNGDATVTWVDFSAGSAQVDERSYRVSIDTNDNRQPIPETLRRLREQPAIMRVLRSIGEHATNMVDGYIIDFRWVQKIIYDDRGLDEGTGSAEFMQRQQDYKTVLPLGAVFQDDEKTLYVGHPALHNEALQLAGWVDGIARSLGAWNDTSSKPPRSK
jgi:hypothetical protein